MPELMITPMPNPLPGGTANASGPGQSDAGTGSDAANAVASPFATVLKSKMGKQTEAADAAGSATASPDTTPTDVQNATANLDLAGLFQILGTSPAASAKAIGATAEQADSKIDGNALPALQAAAVQAPDQTPFALASAPPTAIPLTLPLALPATPPVQTALPPATALQAQAPLAAVAATPAPNPLSPRPATAPINDSSARKQNPDTRNETFTPAGATKSDAAGETSGKLLLDAAINADSGRAGSEGNATELPANDFRALMERAAAMTSGAAAAHGSAANSSLRIDTPLGQSGWHDELGQKLTWMVGNNRQQADLVLNPPHLGRVEVSLTMNGDQATAVFTSSNPAVRDALEASLQRLREVLADAGVSLGQAQVGSESPNQSSRGNEPDSGAGESMRYASAIPLPAAQTLARTSAGRGMVDIFA